MAYSSTFIFAKKQFDDECHQALSRAYGGGQPLEGVVAFDPT